MLSSQALRPGKKGRGSWVPGMRSLCHLWQRPECVLYMAHDQALSLKTLRELGGEKARKTLSFGGLGEKARSQHLRRDLHLLHKAPQRPGRRLSPAVGATKQDTEGSVAHRELPFPFGNGSKGAFQSW